MLIYFIVEEEREADLQVAKTRAVIRKKKCDCMLKHCQYVRNSKASGEFVAVIRVA